MRYEIVRARRALPISLLACACLVRSGPLVAQIDPGGAWRTWHTEHVRVHAKVGLARHALLAASEAERAYRLLSAELRQPRGTIDLVLTDDVDLSNGSSTFFPTNRVVIFLPPPSTSNSAGVYDSWLRFVIVHELVHVFHLDRADGVWRLLQHIFGRAPGLFPNAYQPAWVTEGLATYYESRFSGAGRIRGAFHDQLLSGAARNNRWPGPGDATRTNSTWPAGTIPYAWGGRFFQALTARSGDSAVPRFVDRTSRQLIVFNVNSPMRAAENGAVDYTWGRLRESATVPESATRLLVQGLRGEPRIRLSSDGRLLAYRHLDGRNVEHLVAMSVADGEEVSRQRVNSVGELDWIDGQLYFTQLEFASPASIRSDLYRWALNGRVERLTWGGRYTDVFALREGEVGAVRLQDGQRHVYTLDTARADDVRLTVPPADDWGRIAVSPRGDWIAGALHAGGRWDIALWRAGAPETRLAVTDDAAMDQDPAWSDDGSLLLFASERLGMPQIFAYELVSGAVFQLTNEPTGAREPVLSQTGTLYYSTVLGDGYAIAAEAHWERAASSSRPDSAPEYVAAPPVAARETGYAPWGALLPRYWIPLAHDEADAGLFLGALTASADAVGRTEYALAATVATDNGRWEAVATVAHSRWAAWNLDLLAEQTWEYAGLGPSADGGHAPVSRRERTLEAGVGYRWRRWRSGIGARLGVFLERDDLTNEGTTPPAWVPDSLTFGGARLSLGWWQVERPPLSISPENGVSVNGLYSRRWELGGGGRSSEVRGSVSGFVALPLRGFANWVVAGRVSGGLSGGTHPRRFSLGGVSSEALTLMPGATLGGRRSFPLRGYSSVGGFTRAATGVIELRVPVALVGKGILRLPLLIDKVTADLFAEVGGGWEEREDRDPLVLWDAGGEIGVDLGLGSSFLVRTRVGCAVPLRSASGTEAGNPRFYLALGPSF